MNFSDNEANNQQKNYKKENSILKRIFYIASPMKEKEGYFF